MTNWSKSLSLLTVMFLFCLCFSAYPAKADNMNQQAGIHMQSQSSGHAVIASPDQVYSYSYKVSAEHLCISDCDATLSKTYEPIRLYWFVKNHKAYVYDPNFENQECGFGIFTVFMFLSALFNRLSFKMRRKLWEVKRSLRMNGRNFMSNLDTMLFCWGSNRGLIKCGIQKELWTGELIKKFTLDGRWLSEVPRRDEFVNNNVIHLVDLGADPEVLLNNTTYPIEVVARVDEDVPIALDKIETVNTPITRDELYALPYDKKGSVIESHRLGLEEFAMIKSAHALAPNVAGAKTPIVLTSGASNGATQARLRCKFDDIITAQEHLNDLDVPTDGRVLVLCPAHQADLLRTDETFAKQFKDATAGQILNLYGFRIYTFGRNPKYAVAEGVLTKKALGAVAAPTTDQNASFFFYNQRAAQALGTAEMFYADASTNPEYRRSVVGFRTYHICLPKKTDGFGAIVSAIPAAPPAGG